MPKHFLASEKQGFSETEEIAKQFLGLGNKEIPNEFLVPEMQSISWNSENFRNLFIPIILFFYTNMGLLDFILPAKKKKEGEEEKPALAKVPYEPSVPKVDKDLDMSHMKARVKFRGAFDLDGLYKTMYKWFEDKQFEFHETLYKSKPPELELEWRGERKKTGYIRDVIRVYFHLFGSDVEAVKKGVKQKLMKGRLQIDFWGIVETDYPSITGKRRWTSSMLLALQNFYNKYIIKKELDLAYTDTLYYEVYQLHDVVKDYLDLEAKGHTY